MGTSEFFIVIVGLALLFAVANYGRNTSLGLFGSLLLALITSPLIAFFIIIFSLRKILGLQKKAIKSYRIHQLPKWILSSPWKVIIYLINHLVTRLPSLSL